MQKKLEEGKYNNPNIYLNYAMNNHIVYNFIIYPDIQIFMKIYDIFIDTYRSFA